jgi:hypothetical protein
MAVGLAPAVANAVLNALCRNVAWTQPAAFYVKLHTGDPGAAGTANAAGNTTRLAATFSAASAGAITTSADLAWTNVSTAETYTHISFWDASSGGTFLGSAALTAIAGKAIPAFQWAAQTDLPAVGASLTLTTGSAVPYYLAAY